MSQLKMNHLILLSLENKIITPMRTFFQLYAPAATANCGRRGRSPNFYLKIGFCDPISPFYQPVLPEC